MSWDTETTGVSADARIVEIAVCHWYRGELLRTWSTFLNPPDIRWDDPNVQQALAINQISVAQLEGAPSFETIADQLAEELGSGLWVAHNSPFDQRMLAQEWDRLGRKMPWSAGLHVCTQQLAMRIDGVPKFTRGYKVGDVAARYGIVPSGAHRAAADAETCGRILLAMKDRLPPRARDLGVFMGAAA